MKYIRKSEQKDFLEKYFSNLLSLGYKREALSGTEYNLKTKIISENYYNVKVLWNMNNNTFSLEEK